LRKPELKQMLEQLAEVRERGTKIFRESGADGAIDWWNDGK
jgi:hypothetical protein